MECKMVINKEVHKNLVPIPWDKVRNGYGCYFVNYIGVYKDSFYCHCCEEQLRSSDNAIVHMKNTIHKQKRDAKVPSQVMKKLRLPYSTFEEFVCNGVFPAKSSNFHCLMCDLLMKGPKNLLIHALGKNHRNKKSIFISKVNSFVEPPGTQPPLKKHVSSSAKMDVCEMNVTKSQVSNMVKNQSSAMQSVKPKPLMNNSPARQCSSITSKNSGRKIGQIPCHMCDVKVVSYNDLHVHLTDHFWQRFDPKWDGVDITQLIKIPAQVDNCNITQVSPSSSSNNENVLATAPEPLKIAQSIQASRPGGRSMLQSLEYMERQLNNRIEETTDQQASQAVPVPSTSKSKPVTLKTHKTPSRQMKRKDAFKVQRNIDINRTTSKLDIYAINEELLSNIQLGVVLTYVKKKGLHCLICRKSIHSSLSTFNEHLRSIKHSYYLQQMKEDDLKFKSFPGQLSDLALAIDYMQEFSNEFVQCFACNLRIENDLSAINDHKKTVDHVKKHALLVAKSKNLFQDLKNWMTRDWYNVHKYWCVPCGDRFMVEVSFRAHLRKKSHKDKCAKFVEYKKVIFDFCPTCTTLFYGFSNTFAYHCECKMHKFHANDQFYLVSQLPDKGIKLFTSPESTVDKIIMKIESAESAEKSKGIDILADLEATIKPKYKSAICYLFGSRLSGSATASSDFDVYIDYDCSYHERKIPCIVLHNLKLVEECLKESRIWNIDRTILDSRIPIIRAHHLPTGSECDINLTDGLGVEKSKLLKACGDKFPICRKLIIFLKQWINDCDLGGGHGISGFAIALLVIYYLQTKLILLPVSKLIKSKGVSKMIGHWEAGVNLDFDPVEGNRSSFKNLLQHFFIFYSTFDYRHNVICPLMGYPIYKLKFEDPSSLPTSMEPYKKFVMETKTEEHFSIHSPMCLQDPFDLAHNITRAVKKSTMYRFKQFCSMSAETLQETCEAH